MSAKQSLRENLLATLRACLAKVLAVLLFCHALAALFNDGAH